MKRSSLLQFAWLSIGAAIFTISLKAGAYLITNSVGLLSDALESTVNLMAALIVLAALRVALRPPDTEHAYGHDKVEYLSSIAEGFMILIAAISISVTSINRLLNPQPVEQIGIGLVISAAASVVNLATAVILRHAGRRYRSVALEADAHHLMTDVWTSVGVIVGVGAVGVTRLEWLDPVIALAVAANITWTGLRLVQRSALGLLDTALPTEECQKIQAILKQYRREGIQTHALRTRQSGARRFISLHVLVPGGWTVSHGHDLLERLEADIRAALPQTTVFTHLEPLNEPASFQDMTLDRAR